MTFEFFPALATKTEQCKYSCWQNKFLILNEFSWAQTCMQTTKTMNFLNSLYIYLNLMITFTFRSNILMRHKRTYRILEMEEKLYLEKVKSNSWTLMSFSSSLTWETQNASKIHIFSYVSPNECRWNAADSNWLHICSARWIYAPLGLYGVSMLQDWIR